MIFMGRVGQRGFGLIEIMVGLVIGLIAIMVIGQVAATFEGQKRISTGGSDAQTNGAVALTTLISELRMAGFGLTVPGLGTATANGTLLCPLGINIYYDGTIVSNPGAGPADGGIVAPVRVVNGAAGASDELIVARSDAELGVLATNVQVSVVPPVVRVNSNMGFDQVGQVFVIGAANGSKVCTLLQLSKTATANGDYWDLEFAAGGTKYNPANPAATFATFPSYGVGDKVVNLGLRPALGNSLLSQRGFMYRRYLVVDDRLVIADQSQLPVSTAYTSANTTPLVDEVVNIQAQYGIALAGSQTVTQWVEPAGPTWGSTSLTASDINRIKAVRIAVVSRSAQFDKEDVSPATLSLWTKINPGDDAPPTYAVPDRKFRYKVLTTVVPMKNVVWSRLP